jgi:superfamily II DNA or RNA helicase
VPTTQAASGAAGPITLRDYQAKAVAETEAAFLRMEGPNGEHGGDHNGEPGRVLLVAPTGSGKTRMFAYLAVKAADEGQRVLVIAHRYELLTQARGKLREAGARRVGIFRGKRSLRRGDPDADLGASIQVVSVQSVKALGVHGAHGGLKFEPDLVVIDEAHHALAPSYMELRARFPKARHLGVTATPWWGEGRGLGAYFREVVTVATMRELTEAGFLARARVFTHEHNLASLDLRGVERVGGDYATGALEARVNRRELVGDIIEHWHSHARGERTLCFAASVEHSKSIARRFKDAGVAAEHLDGTTSAEVRERVLGDLRAGRTLVVSNFNLLGEGFDAPSVTCVILARPTLRPQLYLQPVGRGARVEEGSDKTTFVVLDHAGLSLLHGLPEDDRVCTLEGGLEGRDGGEQGPDGWTDGGTGGGPPSGPRMVRRCRGCGYMAPADTAECPECGVSAGRGPRMPMEDVTGRLVECVREVRGGGRDRRFLTHNGETLTVRQWAAKLSVPTTMIYARIRRGLPVERVLSPRNEKLPRDLLCNGEAKSVAAWAAELGLSEATIRNRLSKSANVADALVGRQKNHAHRGTVTVDGVTASLKDHAKRLGVSLSVVYRRLASGASPEDALRPACSREEQMRRAVTARHSGARKLRVGDEELTVGQWAKRTGINIWTIIARRQAGRSPEECIAPVTNPRARNAKQATSTSPGAP